MPDAQTIDWQARLDREFPRGAVVNAWHDPHSIGRLPPPGVTYEIPRIVVLRVADGQPVVLMPVFHGSDKVLGPLHLTSYERLSRILVKVTLAGQKDVMTWNSRISERLARLMAPEREASVKLAPQGGRAVQHTPEEP